MSPLVPVVEEIHRMRDRPFVLGITGAPGAGKSTFVEALARLVGAEHPDVVVSTAPMDGFHLANRELDRLGLVHRKGTPETFDAAGYAAVLARARRPDRATVHAPAFDRAIDEPVAGALAIPPGAGLLLAEGNYLGLAVGAWPAVREAVDQLWFLDVPLDECADRCLRRRLRHGADPVTARHLVDTVDVPNGLLVSGTKGRADRVLSPAAMTAVVGSPDVRRRRR